MGCLVTPMQFLRPTGLLQISVFTHAIAIAADVDSGTRVYQRNEVRPHYDWGLAPFLLINNGDVETAVGSVGHGGADGSHAR